jgi:NAD(P)-dependent dehydrogenase (short-subunit alcohol dehydrogenase family)
MQGEIVGRLSGKVALVTGAGKGIGESIARLFATEGAHVLVAGRTERDVMAVARDIGPHAAGFMLDVGRPDDWHAAIGRTAELWGKLNVLVNNAGITDAGSIESTPEESWRRQMTINLDSVYFGCQTALPLMKASKEPGSIINIGSSFAVRPVGSYLAYCTSKAGVTTLTKSIALHCAAQGYLIRANVIHPGGTQTPMLERTFAETKMPRDQVYAMFRQMHPLGRYGKPEEIAQACVWLASEDSSFTTGSELMVDGGMSIRA